MLIEIKNCALNYKVLKVFCGLLFQVDLTRYNPHESLDDHLSYYGLVGAAEQAKRKDERFKKPTHVVFVEHDEADSNDEEQVISIPARIMSKAAASKIKVRFF